MKIGSILENQNLEKRIAITPELVKKYTSLGFEVCLVENYGSHLGINDRQFKDLGVKISKNESEILNSSDIIVQLGMLSDDKISNIKENQTLILLSTRIPLFWTVFNDQRACPPFAPSLGKDPRARGEREGLKTETQNRSRLPLFLLPAHCLCLPFNPS